MTCPNPDRAQLLALGSTYAADASDLHGSATARQADAPARQSGHAPSTSPMLSNGNKRDTVVSHCAKMRHPNGEARNRSIRLHLTLARCLGAK